MVSQGKIEFSALGNCLATFAGADKAAVAKLEVDLNVEGGMFDYVAFCNSMEAASFVKLNK